MATKVLGKSGCRKVRTLVCWAMLALSLSLAGCASEHLRGDPFHEDEWSTMPRSMRRGEEVGPPTAYSNKARQIERNLGVR